MNKCKIFSKLDIQSAFHQLELTSESREITIFAVHNGVYRYKRLLFGIKCASEQYLMVLEQVLKGCDGVQNIMDDDIAHSASKEDHDRILFKVLNILHERILH